MQWRNLFQILIRILLLPEAANAAIGLVPRNSRTLYLTMPNVSSPYLRHYEGKDPGHVALRAPVAVTIVVAWIWNLSWVIHVECRGEGIILLE